MIWASLAISRLETEMYARCGLKNAEHIEWNTNPEEETETSRLYSLRIIVGIGVLAYLGPVKRTE